MRTYLFPLFGGILLTLGGCNDSPAQKVTKSQKQSVSVVTQWPPLQKDLVKIDSQLLRTNYLIVLDNSGSMNSASCGSKGSKFQTAKAALNIFTQSIGNDDNLSLAVFTGSTAKILVPFGSGQSHRNSFVATVNSLSADQGTPLVGALKFAKSEIETRARAQLGYGIYRIIVVTDGESGDGNPQGIAKEIATTPVELHTIGFCLGKDGEKHSLNIPGYTRYTAAQSPDQLIAGLKAAQAESPSFDVDRLQ
jgi:Ca-activated chloride channel homolog